MITKAHPSAPPGAGPWIERRAKLFEAGDYPDKGVTVSAQHLGALASSFTRPVPILIEHADSPLELGYLIAVEHIEDELFGTISLTEEANRLVEKSGARSLSLGLSPDLGEIREVSLVRNPRIPTAQLYATSLCFERENALENAPGSPPGSADLRSASGEPAHTPGALTSPAASRAETGLHGGDEDWQVRYRRLEREQREAEADRTVGRLLQEGRISPPQSSFAKALLLSDGTVAFDGGAVPVPRLVLAFLESQPKLSLFSELAPEKDPDHSATLMLPEEAEFYRRHFPDVSLEAIAGNRRS